jgi:Flp pilus assembly protein TadD
MLTIKNLAEEPPLAGATQTGAAGFQPASRAASVPAVLVSADVRMRLALAVRKTAATAGLRVKALGVLHVMALLVLLVGCTPSGPRALLEGKRLMDEGQYPQAIQKLRRANELLGSTNALAWEYLGLAYQYSGAVTEAEWAYQRALALNHDLSEVRFNLGCLWLTQNKLEAARGEFTAYTLRRPNAPEGFLKLGATQLRAREPSAAEKSFNEALRLNPQSAEAMNGQGLAKLQRGRATEAARCFENALKQQPGYRPALLNSAIVAHQYLRDHRLALQKYREYMALKPAPPNADNLAATVRQLEQELNPPVRYPATNAVTLAGPNASAPRPLATNATRKVSAPKPEAAATLIKAAATNPPKMETAANVPKAAPSLVIAKSAAEAGPARAQEPLVTAPPALTSPTEPSNGASSAPAVPQGLKTPKRSFFERINPLNLFRSPDRTPGRPIPLETPARSVQNEPAHAGVLEAGAADTTLSVPPTNGPPGRYAHKSPPPPSPESQAKAEGAFEQGVQAYQARKLAEAIKAYRLATQEDPSLYEAHYNLGVAATQAGNLTLALMSYENALAIRPNSLDARYNFALVLKQANRLADAVRELEKVIATYPNEARAHLALGNIYAQQLGQPARARQHYLKVLEVDPQNPQATAIRYWLRDNPP